MAAWLPRSFIQSEVRIHETCSNFHLYGVRGVSQIKFTISDSFLVFFDVDILSTIKRKNPFGFYCVILILNLSHLISQITLFISKVCRV